ncbi:MAG: pre-peptidase C-terminal domain-containing protein, partial [Spirochaetota bacterium]
VDWFHFSVPRGRNPQMIIETHSDIDPMLRLYSADGAEIASDDDSGNDYNARISQQLSGGNVYYIEVSEIDAAVGSYRLEIREY